MALLARAVRRACRRPASTRAVVSRAATWNVADSSWWESGVSPVDARTLVTYSGTSRVQASGVRKGVRGLGAEELMRWSSSSSSSSTTSLSSPLVVPSSLQQRQARISQIQAVASGRAAVGLGSGDVVVETRAGADALGALAILYDELVEVALTKAGGSGTRSIAGKEQAEERAASWLSAMAGVSGRLKTLKTMRGVIQAAIDVGMPKGVANGKAMKDTVRTLHRSGALAAARNGVLKVLREGRVAEVVDKATQMAAVRSVEAKAHRKKLEEEAKAEAEAHRTKLKGEVKAEAEARRKKLEAETKKLEEDEATRLQPVLNLLDSLDARLTVYRSSADEFSTFRSIGRTGRLNVLGDAFSEFDWDTGDVKALVEGIDYQDLLFALLTGEAKQRQFLDGCPQDFPIPKTEEAGGLITPAHGTSRSLTRFAALSNRRPMLHDVVQGAVQVLYPDTPLGSVLTGPRGSGKTELTHQLGIAFSALGEAVGKQVFTVVLGRPKGDSGLVHNQPVTVDCDPKFSSDWCDPRAFFWRGLQHAGVLPRAEEHPMLATLLGAGSGICNSIRNKQNKLMKEGIGFLFIIDEVQDFFLEEGTRQRFVEAVHMLLDNNFPGHVLLTGSSSLIHHMLFPTYGKYSGSVQHVMGISGHAWPGGDLNSSKIITNRGLPLMLPSDASRFFASLPSKGVASAGVTSLRDAFAAKGGERPSEEEVQEAVVYACDGVPRRVLNGKWAQPFIEAIDEAKTGQRDGSKGAQPAIPLALKLMALKQEPGLVQLTSSEGSSDASPSDPTTQDGIDMAAGSRRSGYDRRLSVEEERKLELLYRCVPLVLISRLNALPSPPWDSFRDGLARLAEEKRSQVTPMQVLVEAAAWDVTDEEEQASSRAAANMRTILMQRRALKQEHVKETARMAKAELASFDLELWEAATARFLERGLLLGVPLSNYSPTKIELQGLWAETLVEDVVDSRLDAIERAAICNPTHPALNGVVERLVAGAVCSQGVEGILQQWDKVLDKFVEHPTKVREHLQTIDASQFMMPEDFVSKQVIGQNMAGLPEESMWTKKTKDQDARVVNGVELRINTLVRPTHDSIKTDAVLVLLSRWLVGSGQGEATSQGDNKRLDSAALHIQSKALNVFRQTQASSKVPEARGVFRTMGKALLGSAYGDGTEQGDDGPQPGLPRIVEGLQGVPEGQRVESMLVMFIYAHMASIATPRDKLKTHEVFGDFDVGGIKGKYTSIVIDNELFGALMPEAMAAYALAVGQRQFTGNILE